MFFGAMKEKQVPRKLFFFFFFFCLSFSSAWVILYRVDSLWSGADVCSENKFQVTFYKIKTVQFMYIIKIICCLSQGSQKRGWLINQGFDLIGGVHEENNK